MDAMQTDSSIKESFSSGISILLNAWRNPTKKDVCRWLSRYFEGKNATDVFIKWLGLNSKERQDAELALIEVLETPLLVNSCKMKYESRLGRNVNWERTYLDSISLRPFNYWNQATISKPDGQTISALTNIARAWINEFEWPVFAQQGNYYDRKENLKRALKRHKTVPQLPVFYNHYIAERLKKIDGGGKLVCSLNALIGFESSKFSEDDRKTLIGLVENKAFRHQNENRLLEIIAILSIIHALSTDNGWHIEACPNAMDLKFVLSKNDWQCFVQKGGIRDLDYSKDTRRSTSDPSGLDPDIVMTFGRKKDSGAILLLGDAKNYEHANADMAYRAMMIYMLSFGKAMGITVDTSQKRLFSTPINPATLLFFSDFTKIADDHPVNAFSFSQGHFGQFVQSESTPNHLAKVFSNIEEKLNKLSKLPLKLNTAGKLNFSD